MSRDAKILLVVVVALVAARFLLVDRAVQLGHTMVVLRPTPWWLQLSGVAALALVMLAAHVAGKRRLTPRP